MSSNGRLLRRLFYAGIALGVLIFIWAQGLTPWRLFLTSPLAVTGVAVVSIIGLWVQAKTFVLCLPDEAEPPEFAQLLTIWALGGITSLLAPMLAGVAVRAGMLKRKGLKFRTVMIASMRQMILGVESSALVVGVWLFFRELSSYPHLGSFLIAVWLLLFVARNLATYFLANTKWSWVGGIAAKHKIRVWFYVSMQPVLFALNYWIAYYGVGYPLTMSEAMALAGVTALASLAVVFPNGLGILDAVWVWVAVRNGMELGEGAGLILILRLGYLLGALAAWFVLSQVWLKYKKEECV
jgi:hypothetical protein